MSTPTRAADYVVCVDNADYSASLELHKIYRTLPDEGARADGTCESATKAAKATCPRHHVRSHQPARSGPILPAPRLVS